MNLGISCSLPFKASSLSGFHQEAVCPCNLWALPFIRVIAADKVYINGIADNYLCLPKYFIGVYRHVFIISRADAHHA
jgi:hypothetical protein